ncbi:MAG: carbohydrate ABC transporter permease [Treponema sp.]|nr:carbohydrate ABC transporter permease [Treponema sp.]MCL2271765.1 carbohydrate ABC transporter permease [Treponema sp.]
MSAFRNQLIRKKIFNILALAATIVIAVLVLFPIWWIIRSSLMNNAELYSLPPYLVPPFWRFSNYPKALGFFPFFRYFVNTMIIITPSVTFGTITATFCGYAFARLRFPYKKILFSLCVGSMLLPSMVTLIPIYVMWSRTPFIGTYWPLILPYLCGGGAFNIFLIRQFMRTIPRELDEAAIIDGAGYWTILVRIILPSVKPAMIVVALLLFIILWNDLLQQTIYIQSVEKFTIAIGLTQFKGALMQDWVMLMCATCMAFIPGIVFFLIGQKYFIEGIVLTGMKS